MAYEAIIFDLDGTLWNANESVTKAWNVLLERLNYNMRMSVQDLDSVTGKPMDYCIDKLLPGMKLEHDDFKTLLIHSEQEIVEKAGGAIYPGVITGITELSGSSKIFIVSNCEEWYLHKFLEFSGLGPALSGWDCYGSSKTDKDKMITNIRIKYNLNNVVYIGDTLHDQESARLSDSDFIHVTYGFGELIRDAVSFDSFRDLHLYLMNSPSNQL